jgi:hypothetical protein
MSAPTECEIVREARRVLRKMMQGARLMADGGGRYSVTVRGVRNARIKVSAQMVLAMSLRGWLVEDGGRLTVSLCGKAWLARQGSDPFVEQHQVLATRLVRDPGGRERYVVVNEAESPLAWLRHRGIVTVLEFDAGERLRRDYTLARLAPRLAADLTAPVVSGRRAPAAAMQLPETVLAAKQRFSHAMKAVDPGLSGLLFDVCCDLRGLEECERVRAWPRGSAKLVLKLGLDRLAAHYGIRKTVRRRVRAWREEGGGGGGRPPPNQNGS